jgi:hypothetical protein
VVDALSGFRFLDHSWMRSAMGSNAAGENVRPRQDIQEAVGAPVVSTGSLPGAHYWEGASHPTDRTGILCPYPEAVQYKGTGSTNDSVNFARAKH